MLNQTKYDNLRSAIMNELTTFGYEYAGWADSSQVLNPINVNQPLSINLPENNIMHIAHDMGNGISRYICLVPYRMPDTSQVIFTLAKPDLRTMPSTPGDRWTMVPRDVDYDIRRPIDKLTVKGHLNPENVAREVRLWLDSQLETLDNAYTTVARELTDYAAKQYMLATLTDLGMVQYAKAASVHCDVSETIYLATNKSIQGPKFGVSFTGHSTQITIDLSDIVALPEEIAHLLNYTKTIVRRG